MKLKYTYVINEVAGQKVAVPIDSGYGEQSIIKTNETGAFILELLKNDITLEGIIEAVKRDFEIESESALKAWLDSFLEKLKKADVLLYE